MKSDNETQTLVQSGYTIEVRWLDYDKTKDPTFCVKIKKYTQSTGKIETYATGYSRDSIEGAYVYAVKKFRENPETGGMPEPYK